MCLLRTVCSICLCVLDYHAVVLTFLLIVLFFVSFFILRVIVPWSSRRWCPTRCPVFLCPYVQGCLLSPVCPTVSPCEGYLFAAFAAFCLRRWVDYSWSIMRCVSMRIKCSFIVLEMFLPLEARFKRRIVALCSLFLSVSSRNIAVMRCSLSHWFSIMIKCLHWRSRIYNTSHFTVNCFCYYVSFFDDLLVPLLVPFWFHIAHCIIITVTTFIPLVTNLSVAVCLVCGDANCHGRHVICWFGRDG